MSVSYQVDLKKPRIEKGILEIGVGKLIANHPESEQKILDDAIYVISMISGQKPKIVRSKEFVSGFKLKKGMPVSVLVTLRKKRLLDFIQRLLSYALPRAKDFYGIKENHLDNYGNINLGLKEINVFPEAISDKIKYNFGLGIHLVSSSKKKKENIKMWEELGFPLKL